MGNDEDEESEEEEEEEAEEDGRVLDIVDEDGRDLDVVDGRDLDVVKLIKLVVERDLKVELVAFDGGTVVHAKTGHLSLAT